MKKIIFLLLAMPALFLDGPASRGADAVDSEVSFKRCHGLAPWSLHVRG